LADNMVWILILIMRMIIQIYNTMAKDLLLLVVSKFISNNLAGILTWILNVKMLVQCLFQMINIKYVMHNLKNNVQIKIKMMINVKKKYGKSMSLQELIN